MSQIDQAVQNVLTSKRILLAHPGAAKFNQLYASSDKSTSNLAETVNSRGRFRVTANSLALGTTSNYNVSSSSLLSSMTLNVSLATTAGFKLPHYGWLFEAIQSVEITFSNSMLSNMVVQGPVLREYMLASCCNSVQREELLRRSGDVVAPGVGVVRASVPIGHILSNAAYTCSNFPLDMSTLNGPIIIQITWNSGDKFTVKGTAAYVAPVAWASSELTAVTSDLLDGAFAVKHSLSMNPNLVYSSPGRYLNAISYSLSNVNIGVSQTINLQSAPSGMLSHIILSIRPNTLAADGGAASSGFVGNAAGTQKIHGSSIDLSALSLFYGGQALFEARSFQEIKQYYASAFNGDDLSYSEVECTKTGDDVVSEIKRHASVYCIPLSYDARCTLSDNSTENLPSYSGASLQLSFTPRGVQESLSAAPFSQTDEVLIVQNGISYQVWVLYVLSALVEVSGGSVDMQL